MYNLTEVNDTSLKSPKEKIMSLSLFDLTGQRVLITGSSQGIGFALAMGMAAAGAEIILNGT